MLRQLYWNDSALSDRNPDKVWVIILEQFYHSYHGYCQADESLISETQSTAFVVFYIHLPDYDYI